MDDDARSYYDEGLEADRLQSDRLELVRTRELLGRFLPPPPARVLDVGGAAGVHALHLLGIGYDVRLVDPVPLHVEQARAAGVVEASIGDARSLASADGSVDVVLMLGPLYHLTSAPDRSAALAEARRVLRPGGVVLAAAISRFASTYDGLRRGFLDDPGFEAVVESDLATGVHRNPERRPGWFTTAYFHHPAELRDEVAAAGFTVEALVAIEGVGGLVPDVVDWLDGGRRQDVLLRTIRRVEAEPALLGASSHLLAVGRR